MVSPDNPAAARVTRLGLDDPEMVVITIPGSDTNVPEGIQPGDRIDLAVAVTDVSDMLALEGEKATALTASPGSALTGIPNEALAAVLEEAGYVVSGAGRGGRPRARGDADTRADARRTCPAGTGDQASGAGSAGGECAPQDFGGGCKPTGSGDRRRRARSQDWMW